jgi:nucleoid DNA-binding protein
MTFRAAKRIVLIILAFISESLSRGQPVNLYEIGTLAFKTRKGRTCIWKSKHGLLGNFPNVQPPSACIKFMPSEIMKQKLKALRPFLENYTRPVPKKNQLRNEQRAKERELAAAADSQAAAAKV